jgi:uncharacterized protein with PIN domain
VVQTGTLKLLGKAVALAEAEAEDNGHLLDQLHKLQIMVELDTEMLEVVETASATVLVEAEVELEQQVEVLHLLQCKQEMAELD